VSDPLGSDRAAGGQDGDGRSGADILSGDVPKGIATTITEISERATLLVREEIELAKAEVAEKATKLVKGAVIGIAAGIFVVTALFFVLIGCAWLLYYYLPVGNDFTYFWGFFAMALILLVLGLVAGLIAARAVKRGAPPTPDMAIEEARRIRDTVSSAAPDAPGAATGPSTATAAAPAAGSTPAPYGAAAPHAPSPPDTEPPAGAGTEGAA
jgi:Putative Actinobacterial Holin-X, holin superfamily III